MTTESSPAAAAKPYYSGPWGVHLWIPANNPLGGAWKLTIVDTLAEARAIVNAHNFNWSIGIAERMVAVESSTWGIGMVGPQFIGPAELWAEFHAIGAEDEPESEPTLLSIRQYGRERLTIDRPGAHLPEITEADRKLADEFASVLLSKGMMNQGYYDLVLLGDDHAEHDVETMIA